MSGRIKLLKGDTKVNAEDTPVIEYTYDEPSEFDLSCGTFALGDFVLPQEICPDRFVCSTEGASAELKKFVSCMDAMNCHMLGGMTTNIVAGSEKALFMHQMIPHHQNAVNMAKALLHSGSLQCDDLSDDSEEDCVLQSMMYEIINEQNYQIQTMRVLLADNAAYPESDNCVVAFPEHSVVGQAPSPTGDDSPVQAPPTTGNDSPVQAPSSPTGDDSPAQAPSSEGSTPSGAVCSVHYSSLAFAFGLLALSSTSVVWMM